jgi:hypothetical protein
VLSHTSALTKIASLEDVDRYKVETRQLLQTRFGPTSLVKCYDSKLRKNIPFPRREVDMNDPLHVEGPARGVHVGMGLLLPLKMAHAHNTLSLFQSSEINLRYTY